MHLAEMETMYPVRIDSLLTATAAHISPNRWNGWVVPYFTREQADSVAAQCAAAALEFGPDSVEVPVWDDTLQGYRMTGGGYEDDGEPVTASVIDDGVPLYCIGGFAWCWERAEQATGADVLPFIGDYWQSPETGVTYSPEALRAQWIADVTRHYGDVTAYLAEHYAGDSDAGFSEWLALEFTAGALVWTPLVG